MAYTASNPNGQATSANSAPVVLSSDQSALAIKGNLGSTQTASWTSATTVNTQVAVSTAVYNAVSVAMANTSTMTAGAITFEVSPNSTTGSDGTWFPITMARIDSFTTESSYTLNTVANRAWTTSVDGFTYFRIRLSTVITGTGTAVVFVAPQTFAVEPVVTVGNSTAANLQATVTGTVALSAGATSIGSVTLNAGANTIGNVGLNTGTNSVGIVGLNPSLSAVGLTIFSNQALSNTVTAVKTSAARMHQYDFYNPGAAGVWVQLFNLATGSVTLGTTAPTRTIYLPPTSGRDWSSSFSDSWATALSIAVTTTNTGSTAPASAIQAYIGYL